MMVSTRTRRRAVTGASVALALTLAGCGGNLETQSAASESEFPDGPVTMLVGFDPGGSTDLIARALTEVASDELEVPMPVVNKPGANGALAAQELADAPADGQTVAVLNASLISITPLATGEADAVDIDDFEVITGISQDDYVLVTHPSTGFTSVEDLENAGRELKYGTAGVGTGGQLSAELLFKQAEIPGAAVPFDGGSPALTAVLGNQVDASSIQLGEAKEQIDAGKLVPIVVFSKERNPYLPDVPTAIEAGYDVPVSQYRAVVAPKGTPEDALAELRDAFDAALASDAYQQFNEDNLLTPYEVDGEQVEEDWSSALESYREVVEQYGIQLGEQ